MAIKLEPGDLEACDAAMRMEQAEEDYIRAKHTRYAVTGYDEATDTNTLEKVVDDKAIEAEIQAKGLTAPRITVAHIEKCIVAEAYTTGDAIPVWLISPKVDAARVAAEMSILTVCVLVLKNGFTVTGESACASPQNFDAALGRKIARQKAVEKVWALEGYLLKQELLEYPYGRPRQPGRDEEGR